MSGMSNDVKEECYITMMTGRCVNKADQTEPVGCYETYLFQSSRNVCK